MRVKIGLHLSDFNYLWSKSIDWLREEQEGLIAHYNQAVKNMT